MNFLYAFSIVLVVYPAMGTLFYALVENLKTSTKIKILIITFGHPLLTAIIIWFGCLFFSFEIAEKGVWLIVGTLLRTPFSDRKYLSPVVKDSKAVTIEYFSELLIRKTIRLTSSEITDFTQSTSQRLIDKPSELRVTIPNDTFQFKILDKTTRISM